VAPSRTRRPSKRSAPAPLPKNLNRPLRRPLPRRGPTIGQSISAMPQWLFCHLPLRRSPRPIGKMRQNDLRPGAQNTVAADVLPLEGNRLMANHWPGSPRCTCPSGQGMGGGLSPFLTLIRPRGALADAGRIYEHDQPTPSDTWRVSRHKTRFPESVRRSFSSDIFATSIPPRPFLLPISGGCNLPLNPRLRPKA